MEALLIITFVILVVKYVVKLLGKDKLSQHLYNVYLYLSANKDYKQLHQLKVELRAIHKERLSISAQDQYAKWTKLNRKYDKLKAEVDQLEKNTLSKQAAYLAKIGYLVTFLTTAPLWYYRVMYRKQTLLYLPKGMLPAPVEYWLAFPSVSRGAVGLGGWIYVVNRLIDTAEFLIVALFFSEKVASPAAGTAAGAAAKPGSVKVEEHSEKQ